MSGASIRSGLPFAVFAAVAIAVFSAMFVVIADSAVTWAVLILLATASAGVLVWFKDPKTALLALFLFTLPIEISKALTAEASAYSPALSLFISDVAFLPLMAVWLFDLLIVAKRLPFWSPLHSVALALTLWMTLSAAMSPSSASYYILLNNIKYFIYLVLVADLVREPRTLRIALFAVLAGLSAQLLMATAQFVTGSDLEIKGSKNTDLGRLLIFEQQGGLHFRRLAGFMAHPNNFADYLTFVLPPMIAVLLLGRRVLAGAWIWLMLLTLAGLAALVMALSRGAWIAFAVAMLFLLSAGWHARLVRGRQIAAVALCVMLAGATVATAFPLAIYRITESDQRSSDSRRAMMDQAVLIISRNPIMGVGLSAYNMTAQTNIPISFAGLLPAFRDTILKGVVHNKWLLTFAELGVIGFGLLAWFLIWVIRMPFARMQWQSPVQYALILGCASGALAQATLYLFDHFSYEVGLGILYTNAGFMAGIVAPKRPGA